MSEVEQHFYCYTAEVIPKGSGTGLRAAYKSRKSGEGKQRWFTELDNYMGVNRGIWGGGRAEENWDTPSLFIMAMVAPV